MIPEQFRQLVIRASNDELAGMLRELTLFPNDNEFVKTILEEIKRRKVWESK